MDGLSSLPTSDPISPTQERPSTVGPGGPRERRNPSVTPRKFKRFFTPRFQSDLSLTSARQALREITAPSINRNATQSSPEVPFRSLEEEENSRVPRDLKRRKIAHGGLYPIHSSGEPGFMPREEEEIDENGWEQILSSPCERALLAADDSDDDYMDSTEAPRAPVKRITSLRDRGIAAELLGRSIRGSTRSRRQYETFPVNDYQNETASFYTRPNDVAFSMSIDNPGRCIPFCVTGLNTNSLIALGDEEGRVKLVESTKGGTPAFSQCFLILRPHLNAVIDMAFSQDDLLLATASGDQTARVMDMTTQRTTAILPGHSASLKQVRFQPGNESILATSSRDGAIQIWDLRCRGDKGPQHQTHQPVENNVRVAQASNKITYARPVNSIYDAHRAWNRHGTAPAVTPLYPRDGALDIRSGSVSVTALQFLQAGQEHLLLTACDTNASVRLWDIRLLYNKCKTSPTPISITKPPESHSSWRHFGINSINLSGDGSRIYTLCKDNTVYAYSTAHLITGHAPELVRTSKTRPGPQRGTQEGLAPIYGFRHPKMHANSFYVKSAIRKAKDGKSEMLAVGSSDNCAIIFPTDERYLNFAEPSSAVTDGSVFGPSLSVLRRPALKRVGSGVGICGKLDDSIPICANGTALIRGHDSEVNAVAWSNDGELITVGDDFRIRCWREGDDARNLRQGGETEGRRWNSGWAEVEDGYDDDDDES